MLTEIKDSFLVVPEDSGFPLENIPFGGVYLLSNPGHCYLATRIGKHNFMQEILSSTWEHSKK